MTRYELNNLYFEWLCETVCDRNYTGNRTYNQLLKKLHKTQFAYTIDMDSNRFEDGIDLRYRFGNIYDYSDAMIAHYLDISPCSMLEMMVALSLRIEEHIMCDDSVGDRTAKWFWGMIDNLDLIGLDDTHYSDNLVIQAIRRLERHEYGPHGEGGLFTVENPREDMRNVEIWYQANWYLCNFL